MVVMSDLILCSSAPKFVRQLSASSRSDSEKILPYTSKSQEKADLYDIFSRLRIKFVWIFQSFRLLTLKINEDNKIRMNWKQCCGSGSICFGPPGSDPLVQGLDPAPDPSIIKQK